MNYPKSYHKAVNHLVSFGGHGGNTNHGRQLCAIALKDLRKVFGRKREMNEKRHMYFISGQLPVKG